jgi:glutamine synthetase
MVKIIESLGIPVQYHHHETGAAGQTEITIRHTDLLRAADSQLIVKYVVKNVCRRHQMIATYMPKPVFLDGGNAGHVHQSLVDENGISLFYDPKSSYCSLNKIAMYYIGGLLTHARALCALTNPSTNSYKRLVPGYEAPTNLCFSASNRTACVRIPGWDITPKGCRVEYRPPDSTCVQYLSLAAQLMAVLDGIERKIDAAEYGFGPYDMDITKLQEQERAKIGSLPASLGEALDALEKDHDFLLKGGVFDEDLLNWWIKYKQINDVLPVQLRPHPYEFVLYTDV